MHPVRPINEQESATRYTHLASFSCCSRLASSGRLIKSEELHMDFVTVTQHVHALCHQEETAAHTRQM